MVTLNSYESTDSLQGYDTPTPGIYHVIVDSVDESMEKKDAVIVEFEVLAGTTGSTVEKPQGSEVGKTGREFFYLTEKSQKRLYRLALVTGLKSAQEIDYASQNKLAMDIDFSLAKGRQLIVQFEPNSYEKEGKTVNTVCVEFLGMWAVDDPSKAAVPKSQEHLALLGMAAPPQQSAPVQQQAAPAQQQAAPPQQTAQPPAAAATPNAYDMI